jgi:hypothetical protein
MATNPAEDYNTSSAERKQRFSQLFSALGISNSVDNSEDNKQRWNIFKNQIVDSAETYQTWYNAIVGMAPQLIPALITATRFGAGGTLKEVAEIARAFLMCVKAEWINTVKLQQFNILGTTLQAFSEANTNPQEREMELSFLLEEFLESNIAEFFFGNTQSPRAPPPPEVKEEETKEDMTEDNSKFNKRRRNQDESITQNEAERTKRTKVKPSKAKAATPPPPPVPEFEMEGDQNLNINLQSNNKKKTPKRTRGDEAQDTDTKPAKPQAFTFQRAGQDGQQQAADDEEAPQYLTFRSGIRVNLNKLTADQRYQTRDRDLPVATQRELAVLSGESGIPNQNRPVPMRRNTAAGGERRTNPRAAPAPTVQEEGASQRQTPRPVYEGGNLTNWQDFLPESKQKTTGKRQPKKEKKHFVVVIGRDWIQHWNYPLNSEETEPQMSLATAINKAKTDANYMISNTTRFQDSERVFGRRILLTTEAYNRKPNDILPQDILKYGAWGVHEVTASMGNLDTRHLRELVWEDGMRFWNISKFVADAKVKEPSRLTRDRMITKG